MIVRFKASANLSFRYCIDFHFLYQEESSVRAATGQNVECRKFIQRLQKRIRSRPYNTNDEVDLDSVVGLSQRLNIKFVIWSKPTRQSPLKIAWESSSDDPGITSVHLFLPNFDEFVNTNLSGIAYILDIAKFKEHHNYVEIIDDKSKIRMTLPQAVVAEKYPNCTGAIFRQRVRDFTSEWGTNSFNLGDSKKLHLLTGLGIQIWSTISETRHRKKSLKKVFDTRWKTKLIVEVANFNEKEPIDFSDGLYYIKDSTCLNYFSCVNKHCFFGTDNYLQWQTHVNKCRNTTARTFQQVKYEAPSNEIKKQLVDEKILPSMEFENMYFITYDVESLMCNDANILVKSRIKYKIT